LKEQSGIGGNQITAALGDSGAASIPARGATDQPLPAKPPSELARLKAALTARRIDLVSKDSQVRVTINGMGDILDVTIDPAAVRGAQVHHLNQTITSTIVAARARATKLRAAARSTLFQSTEAGGNPRATGTASAKAREEERQ
jgi:DNA-binding protein YbaB